MNASLGSTASDGTWCGHCGRALTDGDHTRCVVRAELEPPRWCRWCRRRMVVQVLPRGWRARCGEHGETLG